MGTDLQLDRIDYAILNSLQNNAKITNAHLAQAIGLSPAATLERVRKLENGGLVKGYHAKLAHEKLALNTSIILQVSLHSLTKENVAAFSAAITHIPAIVECHQVVGEVDFFLKVITTDIAAYQRLVIEQLTTLKMIKHMRVFVVSATVKETGLSLPTY